MLTKGSSYHFLTLIYILYIQEFQQSLKAFSHVIQRILHFFTIYSVYANKISKFSITSLGCLKCKLDSWVLYYDCKNLSISANSWFFFSFVESVQRLSNKKDFLWEEEVANETWPAS